MDQKRKGSRKKSSRKPRRKGSRKKSSRKSRRKGSRKKSSRKSRRKGSRKNSSRKSRRKGSRKKSSRKSKRKGSRKTQGIRARSKRTDGLGLTCSVDDLTRVEKTKDLLTLPFPTTKTDLDCRDYDAVINYITNIHTTEDESEIKSLIVECIRKKTKGISDSVDLNKYYPGLWSAIINRLNYKKRKRYGDLKTRISVLKKKRPTVNRQVKLKSLIHEFDSIQKADIYWGYPKWTSLAGIVNITEHYNPLTRVHIYIIGEAHDYFKMPESSSTIASLNDFYTELYNRSPALVDLYWEFEFNKSNPDVLLDTILVAHGYQSDNGRGSTDLEEDTTFEDKPRQEPVLGVLIPSMAFFCKEKREKCLVRSHLVDVRADETSDYHTGISLYSEDTRRRGGEIKNEGINNKLAGEMALKSSAMDKMYFLEMKKHIEGSKMAEARKRGVLDGIDALLNKYDVPNYFASYIENFLKHWGTPEKALKSIINDKRVKKELCRSYKATEIVDFINQRLSVLYTRHPDWIASFESYLKRPESTTHFDINGHILINTVAVIALKMDAYNIARIFKIFRSSPTGLNTNPPQQIPRNVVFVGGEAHAHILRKFVNNQQFYLIGRGQPHHLGWSVVDISHHKSIVTDHEGNKIKADFGIDVPLFANNPSLYQSGDNTKQLEPAFINYFDY